MNIGCANKQTEAVAYILAYCVEVEGAELFDVVVGAT